MRVCSEVLLDYISFLCMPMHGHTGLLMFSSIWKVSKMDWLEFFLDLNPLEHVWDALGRRLAVRLRPPANTQQLKQMLIEARLPQELLGNLVLSRESRC
ncbi:hypothetical protein TNCV_843951 [Trichonephila clavipes]|nr:hypothetical protein TNCV_843951 [Trichonephila clavipes]